MPEAKRPDPKRRSPGSRPGRAGRSRGPARREQRDAEGRPGPEAPEPDDGVAIPAAGGHSRGPGRPERPGAQVRKSIAESAEQQSEQRLGSAARRAAILAAVVCVLTLTIAGPVRTYFGQRTEMQQLKATEARLRAEIADLEQQKAKLADPVFIAAQARERLGFVMPGDVPYQVQLPPTAAVPSTPGPDVVQTRPGEPWYTALWDTIADVPHNVPVEGSPPSPEAPAPTTTAPPGAVPPGG